MTVPVTMTTSLEAAVDGADIVYCAVRAGGMAGRVLDETAALAQGVIGQETTGAGRHHVRPADRADRHVDRARSSPSGRRTPRS